MDLSTKEDEFDNIDPSHMDSGDIDAAEPFLQGTAYKQNQRRGSFINSPTWFVLTIILLLLLFIESTYVFAQPKLWRNTYERGFNTELCRIYIYQQNFYNPWMYELIQRSTKQRL